MFQLILVIAGVLILSGFFSGSEAALLTISVAEVESLVANKQMGAGVLQRVKKGISKSVIAIVIMNNAVNIVGSIMVGQIVINLYGNAVLAVTTTGLTFGVILFSEIIPKSLGMHYAQIVSLACAPIILALTTLFSPIIAGLEFITDLFKKGEGRKLGTEDQIRSLVTLGRREGHIETGEGQLIHRAFILNDKFAKDIMTDLKDIVGVNEQSTIQEAAEKIEIHPYTRYPIFGSSIHNIQGVVMRTDLLGKLAENDADLPVTDIKRETLVVNSDTPADDLLRLFREEHTHLAVVQEDDHTVGIVTLEDVLEELVGEIEDEADVEGEEERT